ncbi:hypothetical protein MOG60_020070, partial [Escherichia coli]|nr:hypothetical protein [Escherichia coli]
KLAASPGFFGILAAIAITLVWQRHTRFFH